PRAWRLSRLASKVNPQSFRVQRCVAGQKAQPFRMSRLPACPVKGARRTRRHSEGTHGRRQERDTRDLGEDETSKGLKVTPSGMAVSIRGSFVREEVRKRCDISKAGARGSG